jgi:hypothetical protein
MERVLEYVDHLRRADEVTRTRALFGIAAVGVLLIGAVWLTVLRWQLQGPANPTQAAEEPAGALPTLGEVLSESGSAAQEAARAQLRDLLLGDAPPATEEAPAATQMPEDVIRLPSGSQK